MAVTFTVHVGRVDWDETVKGWRCPALAIPGAEVEKVYAAGTAVDPDWYKVVRGINVVSWIHGNVPPDDATIALTLTKELSTQELTAFWKKAAIVLPVLASVIVSLIAAWGPRFVRTPPPPPASSFNVWTIKGSVKRPAQAEYSEHDIYTFVMPPDFRLKPDYTFEGQLMVETRDGKLVLPNLFVSLTGKVGYETPVIHLVTPGQALPTGVNDDYDQRFDIAQHVIEIRKPIEFRRTSTDPPYNPGQTATPTASTSSPPLVTVSNVSQ